MKYKMSCEFFPFSVFTPPISEKFLKAAVPHYATKGIGRYGSVSHLYSRRRICARSGGIARHRELLHRTYDILKGLGKMYVVDERFKRNIDKYGEGTAEFTADAIAVYTDM